MRCSRSFLSLLLVLATPAAVGAETTIYFFMEHPMEVPPPLVLLVGGLALLGPELGPAGGGRGDGHQSPSVPTGSVRHFPPP
jgi:hypothetical protein